MLRSLAKIAALSLGILASDVDADWPQFRGPNANGVANETSLPTDWSPEKNVAWKVKIPGVAWSCPVVVGDRVFVTTAVSENQPRPAPMDFGGRGGGPPNADRRPGGGEQKKRGEFRKGGFGRGGTPPDAVYRWEVYCLDRNSGNVLWKKLAIEKKPSIPTHRTNTFASETPVSDGQRLFVYFGMTGLFCFDFDGSLVWKKDIGSYPMMSGWGTGSSPVIAGDLLILQCDNEAESFLVAVDKNSGEQKWRVARDQKSTWSTPYLWKNKHRTELVVGGNTLIGYDPGTGEELWRLSGMDSRCAATPVGDEEMLYFGTGGGMGGPGPLAAIKAGAKGDITPDDGKSSSEFVAWIVDRAGPPMASPLLYRGLLYVPDQRGGVLSCFDAKTGKLHYKERLPGARGFTSSPWAAGNHVFILDEDGKTFVLEAGSKLNVLGKNEIHEMCWSTPAIANGSIFLRGLDTLYCFRTQAEKG